MNRRHLLTSVAAGGALAAAMPVSALAASVRHYQTQVWQDEHLIWLWNHDAPDAGRAVMDGARAFATSAWRDNRGVRFVTFERHTDAR